MINICDMSKAVDSLGEDDLAEMNIKMKMKVRGQKEDAICFQHKMFFQGILMGVVWEQVIKARKKAGRVTPTSVTSVKA